MIWLDEAQQPRGTTPVGVPLSEPTDGPGLGEIATSAIQQENDVAGAFGWLTRPQFEDDPDHNPLDVIQGTPYEQDYLDRFVTSGSDAETRSIMSRIDDEAKQRKSISEGGAVGWFASVAAGVASPTTLIPFGGALLRWRTAARAGKALTAAEGAMIGAGAAAAGVATQEAALQVFQETRPLEESLFAVAGAAVLGGVLGGAASALTQRQIDKLGARIVEIPATRAEEATAFQKAANLSAASVDAERGSGQLKSALGAEKFMNFQDPLLRSQTSPFRSARNTVRDLAETPLNLAENADGIATTVGGSVETGIKMAQAPLAEALTDLDAAFSRYRFGRAKRLAVASDTIGRAMGNRSKLSYSQFKEAVFDALVAGGEHEIAEVAEAARKLTAKVFDPHKLDAIKVGLFPEDIKPLDDAGYAPRVYNKDRIRAQRDKFADVLTEHFVANQQRLARQVKDLEAKGKAVDAKVANAAEYSRQEIQSVVDETIDRILGSSDVRLPYDIVSGPRGPLQERVLRVPTSLIRDFVERDVGVLARRYTNTMAADVGLVNKFGSVDMAEQVRKINDEANEAIAAAKTDKERVNLDKARTGAIRDVQAMRDRIRGNYAVPNDPDGIVVRGARTVRNLNYLRLLGGMTLSAVPDLGRPVMVHGLTRVFRDGFVPLITNLRAAKLAAKEVKLAGTALDMVLDSRVMGLAEIMDDYGRHSAFERGIKAGTDAFGVVSLMAPWNAAIKQFAGIVTQTRMLQAIDGLAAGRSVAGKEIEYLAANGIDARMAERISKQVSAHGEKGDAWWANTADWTDREAVKTYRAAIVRDVDRMIVTPGQDKPLWMSTELGKVVGQFKSFQISSTQRILLAGLQQRDAAALNGTIFMLGLGAVAYGLKEKVRGAELSDNPAKWAVEAADYSGLAGWLFEANNAAEKITRGQVGASYFTGEQASRFASRNALGALMGPSFDFVGDALTVTGSAFSGEWTASDTHNLRKMMPLQNLFYIRGLMDKVEDAANSTFGIPERKKRSK